MVKVIKIFNTKQIWRLNTNGSIAAIENFTDANSMYISAALSACWQQVLVPSLQIRAFARQSENWQEPFFRVLQTPLKQTGALGVKVLRMDEEDAGAEGIPLSRTATKAKGTGTRAEVIELPQLNNYHFSAALQWLLAKVTHTKIVSKIIKKNNNVPV